MTQYILMVYIALHSGGLSVHSVPVPFRTLPACETAGQDVVKKFSTLRNTFYVCLADR